MNRLAKRGKIREENQIDTCKDDILEINIAFGIGFLTGILIMAFVCEIIINFTVLPIGRRAEYIEVCDSVMVVDALPDTTIYQCYEIRENDTCMGKYVDRDTFMAKYKYLPVCKEGFWIVNAPCYIPHKEDCREAAGWGAPKNVTR